MTIKVFSSIEKVAQKVNSIDKLEVHFGNKFFLWQMWSGTLCLILRILQGQVHHFKPRFDGKPCIVNLYPVLMGLRGGVPADEEEIGKNKENK